MAQYETSGDILDQVKRLAASEGLTEGGIMKALADAANTIRANERYQMSNEAFRREQFDWQKDTYDTQRKEQKDRQMLMDWITGLSGLGAFGKAEVPETYSLMPNKEGTMSRAMMSAKVPGQQNWLQAILSPLQKDNDWFKNLPFFGGGKI